MFGCSICCRFHHPDERYAYTNWCTLTGGRANNYGTRIDYALADRSLLCPTPTPTSASASASASSDERSERSECSGPRAPPPRGWTPSRNCWLRRDVFGSDHCPLLVELALAFDCPPPARPPPLCTRFMPEFGGGRTQLKLSAFFSASGTGSSAFRDRDNREPAPTEKPAGASTLTPTSTSYECLDLTSEDSHTPTCNWGAQSTLTRAAGASVNSRAPKTQAATAAAAGVKRKASDRAASSAAAHTKITVFFDRVSERKCARNARAEPSAAAPVAARASDRSCSNSSSTTFSETLTLSQQTETQRPSQSAEDAPSARTRTRQAETDATESPASKAEAEAEAFDSEPPESDPATPAAAESVCPKEGAASDARAAWQRLLSAPRAPLCRHGEPAVKRQVRKEGANRGRYFWCCERAAGRANDPAARCGYFQWCQTPTQAKK